MQWLFGRDPVRPDPHVENRLRAAEYEENVALKRSHEAAVDNTRRSDEARAAMEAMLDRMERRRRLS